MAKQYDHFHFSGKIRKEKVVGKGEGGPVGWLKQGEGV